MTVGGLDVDQSQRPDAAPAQGPDGVGCAYSNDANALKAAAQVSGRHFVGPR
jgi:hypothetical protein